MVECGCACAAYSANTFLFLEQGVIFYWVYTVAIGQRGCSPTFLTIITQLTSFMVMNMVSVEGFILPTHAALFGLFQVYVWLDF